MELFRTHLSEQYSSRGFGTWTSQGEVVDCQGRQYVKTGAVMVEGLAGWHPTREQAAAAAADEIDRRVGVLLAQSRKLRGHG